MTAAPNSYSPRVSSFSSTTNSSRTTPSTASSARQSVPVAVVFALRPEPPARPVVWKLRCPSSLPRGGLFFAAPAFRSRSKPHQLLPLLPPRRLLHRPTDGRPARRWTSGVARASSGAVASVPCVRCHGDSTCLQNESAPALHKPEPGLRSVSLRSP